MIMMIMMTIMIVSRFYFGDGVYDSNYDADDNDLSHSWTSKQPGRKATLGLIFQMESGNSLVIIMRIMVTVVLIMVTIS